MVGGTVKQTDAKGDSLLAMWTNFNGTEMPGVLQLGGCHLFSSIIFSSANIDFPCFLPTDAFNF